MKVVLVLGVKFWTKATAFVQTYRPLLLGCDFSNHLVWLWLFLNVVSLCAFS